MKEMTIQEKASSAKQLKKNRLFNELFTDIKNRLTEDFINTKREESSKRENIYLSINCLYEIEAQINGYINEALIDKQP